MSYSRIYRIVINNNDYGSGDSLANLCMSVIVDNENEAALNRLCWFIGESVASIEVIFRTGYFVGYYDKVQLHCQSVKKKS
jgi:deoxyhypusine synthase